MYFAADVGISNRVGATVFLLSDVPVAVWVLALVWPIGLIAFQEIIKRREKKSVTDIHGFCIQIPLIKKRLL